MSAIPPVPRAATSGNCRWCDEQATDVIPDPSKRPGDPTRGQVATCDVHFPDELLNPDRAVAL